MPHTRVPENLNLRVEQPADGAQLQLINERAFGGPAEARLVAALTASGAVTLSLVAELGGQVVGHILFSPVTIDTSGGQTMAVGLAPMAVLPEQQRHGVGSALVRHGLDELRRRGHAAVVVLGHPGFYPRFGFVPASRFGLRSEYDAPDDAFMALELVEGALAGQSGLVRYRKEFSLVV